MPKFPRPTDLESFISRAAALGAATLVVALSGCQPQANSGEADGGKANAKANAKTDGSKTGAAKTAQTDKAAPETPAASDCCRYCFAGTPCGDACLEDGKTCDEPEGRGCACSKDAYEPKQFRKGQMVPSMLGPDVWNYNKAQGDPIAGPFTLEMAFEGAPELADESKGKLHAVFDTTMGSFECELYEDKAPLTVANFVGLARGVRPYLDPKDRRATEWKKGRYYDGTTFHRVIQDFMIQGGDPTGTGMGVPGYFIPDEFDPSLRHDGPGYLSMANRNPYDKRTQKPVYDEKTGLTVGNTGSAQFFVTVRATEPLDDRHTIFGKCQTDVPIAISKVKVLSAPIENKPAEDVVINKIDFVRK